TAEQQATALMHRGREQLVRQRTMLVNALRAHLAEFGIVAAQGLRHVGELIAVFRDDGDTRLPDVARQVLQVLANQIEQIETAITAVERQLLTWKVFRSGREFAAWLPRLEWSQPQVRTPEPALYLPHIATHTTPIAGTSIKMLKIRSRGS